MATLDKQAQLVAAIAKGVDAQLEARFAAVISALKGRADAAKDTDATKWESVNASGTAEDTDATKREPAETPGVAKDADSEKPAETPGITKDADSEKPAETAEVSGATKAANAKESATGAMRFSVDIGRLGLGAKEEIHISINSSIGWTCTLKQDVDPAHLVTAILRMRRELKGGLRSFLSCFNDVNILFSSPSSIRFAVGTGSYTQLCLSAAEQMSLMNALIPVIDECPSLGGVYRFDRVGKAVRDYLECRIGAAGAGQKVRVLIGPIDSDAEFDGHGSDQESDADDKSGDSDDSDDKSDDD